MKRRISVMILIVLLVFLGAVQPAFALDKWGGVTDMLNMALAAGSLLIYTTVWQVNNSVNGLVGDAHAVYEAIKEDVTPKITTWWNGLSAEDQQAFTDKVRSDEDLMVSELIPQDIIVDIVSESVGYTGEKYSNLGRYICPTSSSGMPTIMVDSSNHDMLLEMDSSGFEMLSLISIYMYADHSYFFGYSFDNAAHRYVSVFTSGCSIYEVTIGDLYDAYINGYNDVVSATRTVVTEDYNSEEDGTIWRIGSVVDSVIDRSTYSASVYDGYNPDDQQLEPFYYPVNNLKMADVWDIGTVSDSDLTADTVIYNVVEADTWDVSAGVAESAIAVGLQGDVLVDNDTGLPFALGAVKPWELSASDSAAETTTDTDWTEPATKKLNFDAITDIGDLLLDRFPFCVPYDFYSLMMKFSGGERIAPYWEFELGGAKAIMSLDFMDEIMVKIRTVELMIMVIAWYLYLAKHVQRS